MSAVTMIARLEAVRQIGPSRWIARCPAHEDRSPSLSIRELDDGRVLIHDFAGCDPGDVLNAIGLDLADLFPERLAHSEKSTRPNHWHATREALRVLRVEVLLVAIAAENLSAGVELADEDRERLVLAAGRIRAAAEVVQ